MTYRPEKKPGKNKHTESFIREYRVSYVQSLVTNPKIELELQD